MCLFLSPLWRVGSSRCLAPRKFVPPLCRLPRLASPTPLRRQRCPPKGGLFRVRAVGLERSSEDARRFKSEQLLRASPGSTCTTPWAGDGAHFSSKALLLSEEALGQSAFGVVEKKGRGQGAAGCIPCLVITQLSPQVLEGELRAEAVACRSAFGCELRHSSFFVSWLDGAVVRATSGSPLLVPSRLAAFAVGAEALRANLRSKGLGGAAGGEGGAYLRRRPLTSLMAFAQDAALTAGSGGSEDSEELLTEQLIEFLDADGALFLESPPSGCEGECGDKDRESLRSFLSGGLLAREAEEEVWREQRRNLLPLVESFEAHFQVCLTRAQGLQLERQSADTKGAFRKALHSLPRLPRVALLSAAQQLRSVVVAHELLFGALSPLRTWPPPPPQGPPSLSEALREHSSSEKVASEEEESGPHTFSDEGGGCEDYFVEMRKAAARALDACTIESRFQQRRFGRVFGVHDVERGEALCLLSAAQAAVALSAFHPNHCPDSQFTAPTRSSATRMQLAADDAAATHFQ